MTTENEGSPQALSPRQADALAAIEQFIEQRGYPPTQSELAARLGVASTNAVRDFLLGLERKGYIERDPDTYRGIRVVKQAA